jgi:hypothetical protein
MEKRTREIIAVLLLAALLLAGGGFMAWYLVAGHGWNVAATAIDDKTGNMEGYVCILYEGTDIPREVVSKLPSSPVDSTTLLAQTKSDYNDKGATVFSIHTSAGFRYKAPFVLLRNHYRVGFVPVDSSTPYLTIDEHIASMKQSDVDIIVVLEYSENQYAEAVSGVDIVIQLGETPVVASDSSESSGGTDMQANSSDESANDPVGIPSKQEAVESDGSASTASGDAATDASGELVGASGESGSSSSSDAASSSSDSSVSSSSAKSNAYVSERCDRGSVAVVMISPNNVVSTKTISSD